jgi:hypothetical protein
MKRAGHARFAAHRAYLTIKSRVASLPASAVTLGRDQPVRRAISVREIASCRRNAALICAS